MSTLFSLVRGNDKDKKSNKGFKNAFTYTIAAYMQLNAETKVKK